MAGSRGGVEWQGTGGVGEGRGVVGGSAGAGLSGIHLYTVCPDTISNMLTLMEDAEVG